MYRPTVTVKNNKIPVVSKKELDKIGEEFVADFQPNVLIKPEPVDIDAFAEFYLGMTPDYQYLSHNGIYLGMTVFNNTNKVIVFNPATNRAEYIRAKAHTMIIDKQLLEENQHHRYRFTVGHEASHDILHSACFANNSAFNSYGSVIQCRLDSACGCRKNTKEWNDRDWMEWQANTLSSAILMPKCAVELIANRYREHQNLKNPLCRYILVAHISGTFDVSIAAATIRLKDLGYIDPADTIDYSIGIPFVNITAVAATV